MGKILVVAVLVFAALVLTIVFSKRSAVREDAVDTSGPQPEIIA